MGLKVNFHKSQVAGVGVSKGDIQRFVVVLNCMVMSLLFTYLGMLVGGNPKLESF